MQINGIVGASPYNTYAQAKISRSMKRVQLPKSGALGAGSIASKTETDRGDDVDIFLPYC